MGWLKKACGFWTMALTSVLLVSTAWSGFNNDRWSELSPGEEFLQTVSVIAGLAALLAPVFYSGFFTYKHQRDENAWKYDPATERQMSFADSLGIKYPVGITKGQLSDLIDRAKSESR